ncbi:MAG TPA: NTP transferase domain-containing protein [Patescibacteria group bacterium]|nr:NTP transferase domain-containing protein [Patescibacteria group bacterium]
MKNQFVILAGGQGKRMGGAVPKVLVMLKNKPLILYVLEELDQVGQLAPPVIVVGYKGLEVKTVLGDSYFYAQQTRQLGTAHAVLAAKDLVRADNVVVLYGDMPFIRAASLKRLIKSHFDSGAKISMLTAKVENFGGVYESLEHYGRIIRDQDGRIINSVEFKDASLEQRLITEVNPCIYMFNTAWLWQALPQIGNHNAQGEYYLTDVVPLALAQGAGINSLAVDPGEILGVNTPADLAAAETLI